MRGHPVGGAVGAVKDDMKFIEGVVFRKGIFQKNDISSLGVIDPAGLADLIGHRPQRRHLLGKDQILYLRLHLVGQFETVTAKIS